MKRFVSLFTVVFVLVANLLGASFAAAEPATPDKAAPDAPVRGQVIDGQYIVILKDGATTGSRSVSNILNGTRALYTYSAAVNGFAAKLSAEQVKALSADPAVAYIEQDQVVTLDATQTIGSGGNWGLDRIDQRNRPLSGTYTYASTASNVTAYIIDTGISTSNSDFGGRASVAYDALGGNGQDCNGHGTHVASTVGGTTYGVAKGVRLKAVRVLGCNGSGSTAGIISALDWVRVNATKPAVANMSLGGGFSSALNTAATNLANSGVFLAVAAGNENQNACNVSPASASGTLTVAASDINDAKASFSNYGNCVDVYAPGVNIKSAWLNGGTNTISGTSMASPHAAGVGALYKGTYGDAASSTIVSWIINNSTANVISGNVTGTPNRLLFKAGL